VTPNLGAGRDNDGVQVTSYETLEAARAGDRAAVEALYRELAPAVLGYLRAQGGSDPEDLVSETFVGMVRGLPAFEGDERAFRSWVFSIAHRRLLDERRRLARRPEEPIEPETLPEARGGDVEREAEERLGTRWAVEAIASLTPEQRDVLLLRVLADLAAVDVARILGKSVGAVKSLQRRALLALARQIDREGVS
jgi:RNA polymerase sigma factor (sigma-70 family)